MKVKTLLKTLANIEYVLMNESGCLLEEGFISDYEHEHSCLLSSRYTDWRVKKITTLKDNDTLYIYASF